MKFNKKSNIKNRLKRHPDATENYEGALTFNVDPYMELYLKAASTLIGEPKFYTDAAGSDTALLDSINKMADIDPKFILQLAVYCREELYLRSVPLMLVAEFANNIACKGKVEGARKYVRRIIQRADELTELMSYQLKRNETESREIFVCRWNDIPNRITTFTEMAKRKYGIDIEKLKLKDEIITDDQKISFGDIFTAKLNGTYTKLKIIINGRKIDDLVINNGNVYDESKLPMLIKFGLGMSFPKFDAYQLGKYNKDDVEVKMRDVMFMTHPKPEDEGQEEVFDKLANGTLESPETWEVMRSTGKMTWHDVIRNIFYKNGRINNYMAILRNLRNCLQDESVDDADIVLLCRMISDRNDVLRSKQFPFRFLSAYRVLLYAEGLTAVGRRHLTNVMDALEEAVLYSIENLPRLSGTTLIACDVSGSMERAISTKPVNLEDRFRLLKEDKIRVQRFDIGIMLGMMANKFSSQSITGMFGDDWQVVPMAKTSGILRNTLDMHDREGEVGYSTNGYKVIEYLLDNNIKVDRIMIFTDNQMWDSYSEEEIPFSELYLKYQHRYPDVKLYCFDLSGYGTVVVPQNTKGVCNIGGWSERVFDFVDIFERENKNIVIQKIKSIDVGMTDKVV